MLPSRSSRNRNIFFFFLSCFVFSVRVPVRTDILFCLQEHVAGFEPVPPVWKTGMQPITPYVHWGREVPDLLPLLSCNVLAAFTAIDGTGVEPALPA